MGASNTGHAICAHCGAEYHLFTIFNRDMQGLATGWRKRHERACAARSPAQRNAWARPYLGKDRYESSIVVNPEHEGLKDPASACAARQPGPEGCMQAPAP